MLNNNDRRTARWMEGFLTDLRLAIRQRVPGVGHDQVGLLNAFGSLVLLEAIDSHWTLGHFGGRQAAAAKIGENIGELPAKTVRRYLKAFAQAGIIMGINVYSREKSRYVPLEIIVNPEFQKLMTTFDTGKIRKQFAGVLAELFCSRRLIEGDWQGFGDDPVKWGNLRPGQKGCLIAEALPPNLVITPPKPTGLVKACLEEAAAGKRVSDKAAKEAERKRRRDLKELFIVGAARVWSKHRETGGFGSETPPWAGPTAILPHAVRRERVELERVFDLYGGQRTAIAWSAFCSGRQVLDEKGKVLFNAALAHRQWTTPDKKPSHFAKHLALIFDEVRDLKYDTRSPGMLIRLREAFGASYDAPPIAQPGAQLLKSKAATTTPAQETKDGHQEAARTETGRDLSVAIGQAAVSGDPGRGEEVWTPSPRGAEPVLQQL